jgi:flagellar basal-body rod modification protein FlgD
MTTTSPTSATGATTPQQPAGLLTASDQTTQDAIGLATNFNSFLQLLTTQLKNQDPLAPMDATQFTTQLVQFSQVEQSINTNSRLDQLVKLQSGSQAMSAVGFVGQEIQAFGDQTVLKDGSARFVYTLPSDAASTTITIKNANGDVIRTIANAPKDEGDHILTWDGKDDQGNPMANGTYTFSVSAKDGSDAAIDAVTGVIGTVQGVTVDNGTVVLDLGNGVHSKVTDVFTVNPPQTASNG